LIDARGATRDFFSDVWAMSDKFEMDVREGEVKRVEGESRREREST